MSKREIYEQKTEEYLTPIVEEYGFELVEVEYEKEGSNSYLRAYNDNPGGISVDDCEKVSRRLSDILDEKDYIEDSYIMEISSPGLGRPLKKEKDYKRNLNKEVEIRTYRMIDKRKEFTGILKAYDADTVTIELDDETLKTFSIPFFSLQPLVENSIEHGILQKVEGGSISVICRKKENVVMIKVEDNGIGITEELLANIKEKFKKKERETVVEHIGIYNCYHRLKLFFEEIMQFHIHSEAGKGTRVEIVIQ